MDKTTAQRLVRETFKATFDKQRYRTFIKELCNGFDESKAQEWNSTYVKDAFKAHVKSYERLGTYTSPDGDKLDVLVVHLSADSKMERARTALRDFVADHLKTRDGKDAALVAFDSPSEQMSWRFSYVKMEYASVVKDGGKIGVQTRLTPARRSSYIVGASESCHTAQSRFLDLLQDTENHPTLAQIEEAFSVESVTKEFFREYARLFEDTEAALADVVKRDKTLRDEFKAKGVSTVDFAKKLLGQIVFLYFVQKKGWLGVPKGGQWGDGPRNFLRLLANRAISEKKCLFNDVLEPLFYDTLATDRGHDAWCKTFACRIPFLNGGLFEPLAGYDWKKTEITLSNALFTNETRTDAGDGGEGGTGILDVFDRYNFTVNEAEPLELEVAIDPEMLGKVFENLIEENRRKGLAAFYTPRECAHYMCQESLINYLDNGLNRPAKLRVGPSIVVPRKDVEDWIRQSDQFAHYAAAIAAGTRGDHYPKPPESIRKFSAEIDALLNDITVCDPAIGSGAFPVGMMTEIVRARVALTPYFTDKADRTPYQFKRHAIQHCIYGSDVDSGAVEIAKLRLWLSLVVDEDDVQQIKPLPNLDYKIVVGDSLMGVEQDLDSLPAFRRLEQLKPLHFDETNPRKKQQYKDEIDTIITRLTRNKEVFDFHIYFSEVFHRKHGFDVVIANPPYIGESGHKELFRKTKEGPLAEFYLGKMDYFYFFFHLALNLAGPQGEIAFITTNYYLTATGARKLRADFKQRALIRRLINFNELRIFESALGQHNIVTMLRKGAGDGPVQTCVTNRTGQANPQVLNCILRWNDDDSQYYEVAQTELYDGGENYIRLNRERAAVGSRKPTINAILDKVAAQGEALGKIANINQGVVSGCDYVSSRNEEKLPANTEAIHGDGIFVLDLDNPRDKRVVNGLSESEKKLLRKFYKNSDIHRFSCSTKTSKRLLYIGRDLDDLSEYPQVLEHLNKFKAILCERREVGNGVIKFFQLQWPRSEDIFTGKKIVIPYRSEENAFAYNDAEWFCRSDCYVITQKYPSYALAYLLALLNSRLYFQWLFHRGKRKGKMLEMMQIPLSEIPIKRLDADGQHEFTDLTDRILAAKQCDAEADTSALEREIDQLVYALYGLTPEEIQIVEGSAQ